MSFNPDPCSYANITELRTSAIHMDLVMSFEEKTLTGSATISLTACATTQICSLDTRGLSITGVTDVASGADLKWAFGTSTEALGTALNIDLAAPLGAGDTVSVKVAYATSPDSMAVQWLPPSQTAGGKHPYMFTQCQAIHARALLPCQDSPGVKAPYTASLTVPDGLVGLMSAISTEFPAATGDGSPRTFKFEQTVPMATYLIAIAAGNLEKRDVGPRTAVWSEPEMVEAGAYEFADTEKFVAIGEAIMTPYEWGRYDVLLLPPSFPYGGMENPCLTFVTPTLLAGDRSQATVIAHEVTHSWMGNLVSPETWDHFWLNEGWTRFVETKIMERHEGKPIAHLKVNEGLKALRDAVEEFGPTHEFTKLVPNLDGGDPDDAFSSIPYEKGMSFLWYLQKVVGGDEPMEEFLVAYIHFFRHHALTSERFKSFFLDYFSLRVPAATLEQIDWDTWLYSAGMPPEVPEPVMDKLQDAKALAAKWINDKGAGCSAADAEALHSEQIVVMLDEILILAKTLPHESLAQMEEMYKLSVVKNSEIRMRWCMLGVASSWEPIYENAVGFLEAQGRMKFVRPLYRNLYRTGGPGKELALATFAKNRGSYHNIASKMIARDLELAS